MGNLENGIAAYKAGQRDEARKFFIAALKEDQKNAHMSVFLSDKMAYIFLSFDFTFHKNFGA